MGPIWHRHNMHIRTREKEFGLDRYFMDIEFGSRSSSYKSPRPGRRSSSLRNTTPTKPKVDKNLSSTSTRAITPIPTTLVSAPLSSTLSSSVPSTLSNSVLSEPTGAVSSGSSSPVLSTSSISGETTPTSRSYASSSTYMSTWDYGTGPYFSRATRDRSTSPQSQRSAFNLNDLASEDESNEV